MPCQERVIACDASEWGKGAAHATVAPEIIAAQTRFRERWRFKKDVSALRDLRTNALEQVILPSWSKVGLLLESENWGVA